MLTSAKLRRKPAVFRAMTGLTVAEFDALCAEVAPLAAAVEPPRRSPKPRQRRRGAGHPFQHSLEDRLLMTLMWLRLYPTYEALGVWFDLDQSNVWRTVDRLLGVLKQVTAADISWPVEGQRKKQLAELMGDFPEVQVIIDSTEQRIQRPKRAAPPAAEAPPALPRAPPRGKPVRSGRTATIRGRRRRTR